MFTSATHAESAFYRAFENSDIEAMMAVWALDPNIACIHPMGSRLMGRDDIHQSWVEIFQGQSTVNFQLTDVKIVETAELSVRIVEENISFSSTQHAVVLATNVYKLTATGWQMFLHHGSPTSAAMKCDTHVRSSLH